MSQFKLCTTIVCNFHMCLTTDQKKIYYGKITFAREILSAWIWMQVQGGFVVFVLVLSWSVKTFKIIFRKILHSLLYSRLNFLFLFFFLVKFAIIYIILKLIFSLFGVHTTPIYVAMCYLYLGAESLQKLQHFACEFSRLFLWASWFHVAFLCASNSSPVHQGGPKDPTEFPH